MDKTTMLEEEVAGVRRGEERLQEEREEQGESRRRVTYRLEGLENFIISSLGMASWGEFGFR